MNPKLDLMLGTIERALEVAILPNATNPSAREEASLALLFTRWIRDVVDDVGDAERASAEDCRAALAGVRSMLEADPAGRRALESCGLRSLADPKESTTVALLRQETHAIKAFLGRLLQQLRADGAGPLAGAVRLRLYDLGAREIERERAFGRATRLDPEWSSIPRLAELSRKDRK